MYKSYFSFFIVLFTLCGLSFNVYAQRTAVKTNFAYWATTTPNLGMEFAFGKKTTLEIAGGLNPFILKQEKNAADAMNPIARETKFKHWLVQPELRFWTCESFNGHFFGIHAHGGQYNVGGIDLPPGRLKAFKENRYQGYLYGAGLSYGYQWILSPRWNFELSLGGGFARIHYEKYPCTNCGSKEAEGEYNYFGVTKAAVSLIYVIK